MLAAEPSHGLDDHASSITTDRTQGVGLENTLCPGCKLSAVNESGGLVVAFGQSFFHVDCFKCAKCGDKVTADTNLLLLSDGSPICANCSYSCNVCHQPILDEAIMTGDDAYHAHCFKCKVCKNRIDELVFAKTSQGIYCMNCHNERMIKVRKHAQKKAERDRERATNGGSSSTRSRSQNRDPNDMSARGSSNRYPESVNSMPSQSSINSHNPSATSPINHRPSASRLSPSQPSFPNSPQPPLPLQLPEGRPRASSQTNGDPERTPVAPRIRTPQNGTVPLDGTLPPNGITAPPIEALKIMPNKRSKRHSINPGLVLASTSAENLRKPTSPPTLSPNSAATFHTAPQRSPTPPVSGGRDSPRVPSPLREHFPSRGVSPSISRPSSRGSHREATFPLTPPPYESQRVLNDPQRSRTISASGAMSSTDLRSRPPLRPTVTVDSVPQTLTEGANGSISPDITVNGSTIRHQYSFDEGRRSGPRNNHRLSTTPSLSILDERSRSRSVSPRPGSPMHRVDVPYNVESGTDTEDSKQSGDEVLIVASPPPLPPKDLRSPPSATATLSPLSPDADTADGCEDTELESNRVERVSHSTFIAPALPPIRFSMSGADFSELLTSVGGMPPLKNLDQMAFQQSQIALQQKAAESGQMPPMPSTPEANESEQVDSPRSDITIFFGEGEMTSPRTNGRRSLDSKGVPPLPKRNQVESPYVRAVDLETSASVDSYNTTTPSKSAVTLVRSKSEARTSPSFKSTHRRLPSNASAKSQSESAQTHTTLIENGSSAPTAKRPDTSDLVLRRLREAIADANERGAQQLKLDKGFIEAIIQQMEQKSTQFLELKGNLDGIRRASKQFQDGLTVAQAEYDRELKARRDAEAEVTRLRVLLSGQAVRLTALSGDTRKQQLKEQLSKDLNDSLNGLEQDLSKLKVARDVALAEVEELSASKSAPEEAVAPTGLSRSLTTRLEKIRGQYQQELVPLKHQREALDREIAELKAARDIILEESTVLSARNEELAQLNTQYARRIESLPENTSYKPRQSSFDKYRSTHQVTASVPALNMNPSFNSSTTSITPLSEESIESSSKPHKAIKSDADVTPSSKTKFKWPGSRAKEALAAVAEAPAKAGRTLEHAFQQVSVLRFAKCDHCAETLWGSQLRCNACHISIHNRCLQSVSGSCHPPAPKEDGPNDAPPPSMFGRELIEQVQADSVITGTERNVPVIVEKCIEAVEASALEYEGIYRKTGGSGQSKTITSLFERGNYDAFDLKDMDRFNDICSVTSVLKTYFRTLPVPLFTYSLHESFMSAVHVRDLAARDQQLRELIDQLPTEHYYTLKMLMLHLNRICELSEKNLMNARNLGVVFGPTLLRSQDPSAEFGDMAGKALSVEWLVENAPSVFTR